MSGSAKTVAIIQSSYLPWKGYFDVIDRVDEFILLDDVQYTAQNWRNRNRIKTAAGLLWLTIPIARGGLEMRIDEARVSDQRWRKKHWRTLTQHYARAPYFDHERDRFEALYLGSVEVRLSAINERFIAALCDVLGITTPIRRSADYGVTGRASQRVVDLCRAAGATRYLSGPAAKAYLDESLFRSNGIDVAWMDYSGYREYPQLHPPFEHAVSVVDLIFNTGPAARDYLHATAAGSTA
jgi:WbqC-like protein family